MAKHQNTRRGFVICLRNDGYPASLEPLKIYQAIPDAKAARHNHVRVIDESGEDYLFPKQFFVAVSLPAEVRKALRKAG